MALSSIEQLTIQFYEWEKRGRGWYVFGFPVDIEPPFTPFRYHFTPYKQNIDDAGKTGVYDGLFKMFSGKKEPVAQEPEPNTELAAVPFEQDSELCIFSVSLPKGHVVDKEQSVQLLGMLSVCRNPISFEIIATTTSICLQFVCSDPDALHVRSQLKAFFPESIIQEKDDLDTILDESQDTSFIDIGLRDEFMLTIGTSKNFSIDPLTGLFGLFENIQSGVTGIVQILFKGTVDPWVNSILSSVIDSEGDSFFLDAPDMPKRAQEKISSPLFGVVMRAIGQSDSKVQAQNIAQSLAKVLCQMSGSPENSLIPLSNSEYPFDDHFDDVRLRQSHRLGMLLNADELVSFVHIPSASVVSSKLGRDTKKTKIAPSIAKGNDLLLGMNNHQDQSTPVTVSGEQRLRHTHIIGATGTGKSTLLQNLILQDINQGNGVAVLDPHGDLIENILVNIPANRVSDVVLVDPADSLFPIGFNILSVKSDLEKDVLSSDLIAVFRRLSTSWGDQMNSVFANAILAFLENSKTGTLMDLRRFLVEKSFRDSYLKTVTDPSITYYWMKEYPLVKSASIGPILTRLDTFLRPKLIRNMVGQKKSLDFDNILNSGKILLVKLSQGLIGDENSYLLGTVFVSKIYQAAMARQAQGKETRKDFFLYVDEFQNFITPSMSRILSGARKYHLGLILAHQDMQQLVQEDQALAGSVIANAGTRICFRLGDTDAKRFEDGFSFFDSEDLQNLETGQAIVRFERPDYDFNLSVSPIKETNTEFSKNIRTQVIEHTRAKYGTPKETVEASFEYFNVTTEEEKPAIPKQPPVVIPQKEVAVVQKPENTEIEKPVVVEGLNQEKIQETTDRLVKQKELSQHRYMQTLIKKMAEARGYKALIEEPTPDGKGRVDVALEKNGKKIACEIGVTTSKEWEVHNIEKCIAAGYDPVIAISNDKKGIELMQKQVNETLDANTRKKVFVMEPEQLFFYLDTETAKEATTEKRVKGYRVKVEYSASPQEETKQRRESVAKAVLNSLKKVDK
jgi:hypothetical protein